MKLPDGYLVYPQDERISDFVSQAESSKISLTKVYAHRHNLFILVLVIVLALSPFVRFASYDLLGALLIAMATSVGAFHVYRVVAAKNLFSEIDPAFGSIHLERLLARAEKELEANSGTYSQSRFKISLCNYEIQKISGAILLATIFWEGALLSIGTLIWGFGDSAFGVSPVSGD